MVNQIGTYRLYSGGQSEYLAYQNNSYDWAEFSTHGRGVDLSFANGDGCLAEFLVTGKIYYLVTQDGNGYKYVYASGSNKFELKSSTCVQNRIYLYLPKGCVYTSQSNLTGYFYVFGYSFKTSRIAEFAKCLTDHVNLKQLGACRDVIAIDCQPNCENKKCDSSDGCGLPCGCRKGKCHSGKCIDHSVDSKSDSQNGDQSIDVQSNNWIWCIVIVIGIILLIILIIWYFSCRDTCVQSTPVVYMCKTRVEPPVPVSTPTPTIVPTPTPTPTIIVPTPTPTPTPTTIVSSPTLSRSPFVPSVPPERPLLNDEPVLPRLVRPPSRTVLLSDLPSRTLPEPKSEPRSEPKSKPKPESKSEPRSEPKSKPKPESKSISTSGSEFPISGIRSPGVKSLPKVTLPRSEPRSEPKLEPRSEPRSEPRTEPKTPPTSLPTIEASLRKVSPQSLSPIESSSPISRSPFVLPPEISPR